MNCVVEQLEKNMRYRLLNINGEHYILDMERSLLKIIFPFLFWILPSTVYKIDNKTIVDRLREPIREKTSKPALLPLAGIGYFIGILLAPLMSYFEISTSLLTNLLSVVLTLIFVALLFFSISYQNKKKLYDVVDLEANVKVKMWISPSSIKHVFNVFVVYILLLAIVSLGFLLYIQTGNIMVLIIVSGFLFLLYSTCRLTVEEGHTTVNLNMRFQ